MKRIKIPKIPAEGDNRTYGMLADSSIDYAMQTVPEENRNEAVLTACMLRIGAQLLSLDPYERIRSMREIGGAILKMCEECERKERMAR